jgi:hypothetical protein
MYADVPKELHPAAGQSVYAQIIKLVEEEIVVCQEAPRLDSLYFLK